MKKLIALILFIPSLLWSAPILHFSDLTSGPKTGGDSYGGAIITIWGTGLGASQGTSKVYVGGVESDHVYYWGTSDGGASGGGPANLSKLNIQEISFSVPSTAADGAGTIYVTVGGVNSNTLAFTVRTGNIYFVDGTSGGTGTFASPWTSPASYCDAMVPGDICYFMGTRTYEDNYGDPPWHGSQFMFLSDSVADYPHGTAANPIAFVVYPGAAITLNNTESNGSNIEPYRDYYTFSKFRCTSAFVCLLEGGVETRYIGNECYSVNPNWEGIIEFGTDNGPIRCYGNEVYGITSADKMDHAIYLNGCPDGDLDVGWNYIYDCSVAQGPYIVVNHQWSAYADKDCKGSYDHYIHDNYIDATAHPSRGIVVYDQGYNTDEGALRIPSTYIYNNILVNCGTYADSLNHGAILIMSAHSYIFNNTLYNSGRIGIQVSDGYEDTAGTTAILSSEIRNNIIHMRASPAPVAYVEYIDGIEDLITTSNNLYYGYSGHDSKDSAYVEGNPLFTTAGSDFSLQATSPAKDAGTSTGTGLTTYVLKDFIGTTRPVNSIYDIGAYEYTSGEATVYRTLSNIVLGAGIIAQ